MPPDPTAAYTAYAARDPRFDGVFYVGVTSTGIYCRPICPAKTPKAANCRFFDTAAAAEAARFRPCLRCRPELAPGQAPVDDAHRIAELLVQRIEEGRLNDPESIEALADTFGWSARQIRRIVARELGVSPMALVLTRRLLLAKQLLTETTLPITDIAFASGFASVRRFNDAFLDRYGMPPTHFRGAARRGDALPNTTLTLQLAYRPPFDWNGMLQFLRARTLQGVERVDETTYARSVRLGVYTGWLRVQQDAATRTLRLSLSASLTPVLPVALGRVRHLFDLTARPDVIDETLARDPRLQPLVTRTPGLRVPGAFDGFELAVRAILGQQISVKAATTLAGRFVATFGDAISTGEEGITHHSPTPARVAQASVEEIASLGITSARARSLIALAQEMTSGALVLDAGAPPEPVIAQLMAIPGIGAWTAHYIAMRALRWPDAFPKEDIILRKWLGGVTPAAADAESQSWRPWRSYATLHIWRASADAS